MTFWAVLFPILFIVVFPMILFVKFREHPISILGVFISMCGFFYSHFWWKDAQLLPEYAFTRTLIFIIMLISTIGIGFCCMESNVKQRYFGIKWLAMILVLVIGVTYSSAVYEHGEAIYQKNIEISTYTKTERYELLSFNLEDDNEQIEKTEDSEIFLGLDRESKILYWCFFYRNDKGAKVMYCLDGEKLDTTKVFETLVAGEKPYFEIVSTVEVQTNNNVSPAEVTENVIKTEYHLYTPDDDYLPRTIYMNFN